MAKGKNSAPKPAAGKGAKVKYTAPVSDSDDDSAESGNFISFDKKHKDSDDEDGQEVFNLALDKDDDEQVSCDPLTCLEN